MPTALNSSWQIFEFASDNLKHIYFSLKNEPIKAYLWRQSVWKATKSWFFRAK